MAENPSSVFSGIHTIGEMGLNNVGERSKAGAQAEPKGRGERKDERGGQEQQEV